METIKLILALISEITAIGIPPAIADESAFRAWCAKFVNVLNTLAKVTPTTADDQLAKLVTLGVADDDLWVIFYGLLTDMMDSQITRAGEHDPRVVALATATGFDPATILAIVSALIEILHLFWKGKA